MATVLLIWNTEDDLSAIGKIDNRDDSFEWIKSNQELEVLVEPNRFSRCFLLAELTWNGKPRTEFYGFKNIRKNYVFFYHLLFPVFICSYRPLEFFHANKAAYIIFFERRAIILFTYHRIYCNLGANIPGVR